jgi:hypothetical protein
MKRTYQPSKRTRKRQFGFGPDKNKGWKSYFGPAASARPEASNSRRRGIAIRASYRLRYYGPPWADTV